MSKIKKLRIDPTDLHAKFQPKKSKNEGVIHDLVILLSKNFLVIFSESFGMVSNGYMPILGPIARSRSSNPGNVTVEPRGGVLLSISSKISLKNILLLETVL